MYDWGTTAGSRPRGIAGVLLCLLLGAISACARPDPSPGDGIIGAHISAIPKHDIIRYRVDPRVGILLSRIVEGSPAEEAGLQRQDILIRINGVTLRSFRDLRQQLHAGTKAHIDLFRRGEMLTITVTPGAADPQRQPISDEAHEYELHWREKVYATCPFRHELYALDSVLQDQ